MTRVIGGEASGRRIKVPRGSVVRPTTDRVKESLFSALEARMPLEGARVLDAFAGSGALGIEALSRGAEHVTFVELRGAVLEVLHANLCSLGFESRAEVLRGDIVRRLGQLKDRQGGGEIPKAGAARIHDSAARIHDILTYDIAFCDPPYRYKSWSVLLELLPAKLLVIEADRPVVGAGDGAADWKVHYEKRLGSTVIQFAERACPSRISLGA